MCRTCLHRGAVKKISRVVALQVIPPNSNACMRPAYTRNDERGSNTIDEDYSGGHDGDVNTMRQRHRRYIAVGASCCGCLLLAGRRALWPWTSGCSPERNRLVLETARFFLRFALLRFLICFSRPTFLERVIFPVMATTAASGFLARGAWIEPRRNSRASLGKGARRSGEWRRRKGVGGER